jgi:uncharacterized protein (TIGR03086 family)
VDVVDALDQTFAHAAGVIAGVRAVQLGDATPCAEWTVRDLLEHMIGVVAGIGASAAGQPPTAFELGSDPAGQFATASAASLEAWRQPGVLDQIVDGPGGQMPGQVLASINLLDTATHAWDLATATKQPAELPDGVADAAMEASRMIVTDELRPGRFDAEQAVPSSASPTQRLVAFLGRTG